MDCNFFNNFSFDNFQYNILFVNNLYTIAIFFGDHEVAPKVILRIKLRNKDFINKFLIIKFAFSFE